MHPRKRKLMVDEALLQGAGVAKRRKMLSSGDQHHYSLLDDQTAPAAESKLRRQRLREIMDSEGIDVARTPPPASCLLLPSAASSLLPAACCLRPDC